MPTPQGYSIRALRDFVGHDFGASAPITVDQERINTFADITGDHQWIHVDVTRAKAESPFGGPVAHGFLTLSLLAAFESQNDWHAFGFRNFTNYGANKLRFISPVPAGARIRAHSRIVAVE